PGMQQQLMAGMGDDQDGSRRSVHGPSCADPTLAAARPPRQTKSFAGPPCVAVLRTNPRSGEIEAIQVHHLGPGGGKVLHELLLRATLCIDLCEGAQDRVRAEDEIDARAGPPKLVRLA